MPQGPIQVFDAGRGTRATLNVTPANASTPVAAVRIVQVSVLAAGSGPLVINDSATLLGAITANEVWNVATAASATINMPLHSGGFVVSSIGAATRVAISYE
jgi:hypothetical protein